MSVCKCVFIQLITEKISTFMTMLNKEEKNKESRKKNKGIKE